MANMELIEARTSTSSSVTFSSIPQTYTDLKLVISSRTSFATTSSLLFRPNGSASNLTAKRIYGTGTTVLSDSGTNALQNGADTTSNTFTNIEVYFPNYTSSNYKSFSLDGVMENNATFGYAYVLAYLWSNTAAISSLTLEADGNFLSGSTFYLYGISNVTSGSKATGGIVSSDGTYWYHTFPFSGTFTPTQSLTVDYLVVAGGGGGGGGYRAGGGGAGGLRSTVTATGGGGSLETALSLTANTAYTVTVGGGGVGVTNANGTSGSNSVFSSITSTGGGYGGGNWDTGNAGGSGGSGGGGMGNSSTAPLTGQGGARTASPVQGFNGGAGFRGDTQVGGGGGGAGAIGQNGGSGGTDGDGGTGVQITSFANATQTGADNGYYAAGGGGGNYGSGNVTIGGTGGAGAGGSGDSPYKNGVSAVVNTGSGGGGASGDSYKGGNGGSGLVIIRYAI